MAGQRFDFELDHEVGFGPVTAHGGVPVVVEHFRSSGAAAIVDREVVHKKRKRGLTASELVRSLLALWAGGADGGAPRHWAEWDDLPDGALNQDQGVVGRPRYIAIRVSKKQGALFADGAEVKCFCVVTNRNDPADGDAGDLLRWHRLKAGSVEHTHHVLVNNWPPRPRRARRSAPTQRGSASTSSSTTC